jgi:hypothetical protein
MVIAHFIAFTWISNMAAAILKAVGHFRFSIFDFDGMSRTYSSNFIWIRRKLTELLQFLFFFSKWRLPPSWIWWSMIFDQKSNVYALVSIYSSNFVSNISWFDWEISFYWFLEFGWETIDQALSWRFLGVIDPINRSFFQLDPKRHFLGWKRIVWALDHGNRFTRSTCGGQQKIIWKEKKGKRREGMEATHKKSQTFYISRSHEDGTPNAISMKFWSNVYMVNIINSAEFDHCSLSGLNLARV